MRDGEGDGGLQVLLLQRAEKGDYNSGAWVFPGGLIDAADRDAHEVCTGLDDAEASRRLGVAEGGLDHHVAAVRECFEEAGVLLACDRSGRSPTFEGAWGEALLSQRGPLHRGERGFVDFCREHGLSLPMDRVHYVGHWITPRGRAKRFDTRFFLAMLPEGQDTAHDQVETTDHVWLAPAQALEPSHSRKLMPPTRAMLKWLSDFPDCAALQAWTGQPRVVERVLPRLASGPTGVEAIRPGHPAYDEVGWLDPQGRGQVLSLLQAGAAVTLLPRVQRWVDAEYGRNSYLVRSSADAAGFDIVIDPAVPGPAQRDALLRAAGTPPRWVLTTHAAPENVEAARQLIALTGARGAGPGLDASVPGTPGDLCWWEEAREDGLRGWLLESEGLLFCGPRPVGRRGLSEGPRWAAPASGFVVALGAEQEPW